VNATTPAERRQHLCFRLAGADYAVGILQVREILQFTDLTRVPGVPPSVRGVINLRGTVVPVIDLAVKFGLGETPVGRRTCVLIVEAAVAGERLVLGVMADEVREVLELGPDDVERPPSFGTQVRVDFLAGMGKLGKGFALLLDLDKVLSAEDGAYLARAAEGPAAPAPAAAPS
jgi:purine-binding chemotaxis protein CheW